jgi:hypothetical protein
MAMIACHERASSKGRADSEGEGYASGYGDIDSGEMEEYTEEHRPKWSCQDGIVIAWAQPMAGKNMVNGSGGPPTLVAALSRISDPARMIGEVGGQVHEPDPNEDSQDDPDAPVSEAKDRRQRTEVFLCWRIVKSHAES